MVKTLRVTETTYSLVMNLVGKLQQLAKKRVTVDEALRNALDTGLAEKDPNAWDKLKSLQFKGPRTNCVEEIDLLQ
ncbi:MAG: hypothetical protein AABX01_05420 [Candidatus Micrarchaeota archaeon]